MEYMRVGIRDVFDSFSRNKVVLALFALALLTRLPLMSISLDEVDAANFHNALAYGYNVPWLRPHPPMQEITRVPSTPEFVEGIIALRGKVIPVVDLRKKFDLPVGEQDKNNRIVVVDIAGQDIGVVVDAVNEVVRVPSNSVEPPSSIIATTDSEYLLEIAKLEDRLIIRLDLERLLSSIENYLNA